VGRRVRRSTDSGGGGGGKWEPVDVVGSVIAFVSILVRQETGGAQRRSTDRWHL
jgi:hypothetical protein